MAKPELGIRSPGPRQPTQPQSSFGSCFCLSPKAGTPQNPVPEPLNTARHLWGGQEPCRNPVPEPPKHSRDSGEDRILQGSYP